MIQQGDTVKRVAAGAHALVPKGTVGTVASCNHLVLTLAEHPQLVLLVSDFVKVL